jgi:hypothetical protein
VSGAWTVTNDRIQIDWFAEAGQPPRKRLADEVDRIATILDLSPELSVRTA